MSNNLSPNPFRSLPVVVKNLLIINCLMFLAQVSLKETSGIDLVNNLGLHLIGSKGFHPYQIITGIFIHNDLMHLFFNMFAVWFFGAAVEMVWGAKRFLQFYLITGVFAGLIQMGAFYIEKKPAFDALEICINEPKPDNINAYLNPTALKIDPDKIEFITELNNFVVQYNNSYKQNPEATEASATYILADLRSSYLNAFCGVGASGALFGLLVAFGMLFPNFYLSIYFFIPIKAKYFVALYGLMELVSGIQNNPNDNVGHFAHLGGLVIGFLIIKFWYRKSTRFRN